MIQKYDQIKIISGTEIKDVEKEVNDFLYELSKDGIGAPEINILFDTTFEGLFSNVTYSYTIIYLKRN